MGGFSGPPDFPSDVDEAFALIREDARSHNKETDALRSPGEAMFLAGDGGPPETTRHSCCQENEAPRSPAPRSRRVPFH